MPSCVCNNFWCDVAESGLADNLEPCLSNLRNCRLVTGFVQPEYCLLDRSKELNFCRQNRSLIVLPSWFIPSKFGALSYFKSFHNGVMLLINRQIIIKDTVRIEI